MFEKLQKLIVLIALLPTLETLGEVHKDESVYTVAFKSIGTVDILGFGQADPQDTADLQDNVETLFYKYWSVQDFQGYKDLFYQQEYPAIDEVKFLSWRKMVPASEAHIKAKVYVRIKGKDFCIIQNGKSDGRIVNCFMMKRVMDRWYPVSAKENVLYKELRNLWVTARPEALAALLDIEPYKKQSYIPEATLQSLQKKFVANGHILGSELLAVIDSIKDDPTKEIESGSLILTCFYKPMDKSMMKTAASAEDLQFGSYLDSLGLANDQKKMVLEMIHRGSYTASATLIKKLKAANSVKPFVSKIRAIYGQDKIWIYNSTENKWR